MNKDKFVILSDIHANLTALKAVLSDIQAQGYLPDAVVILGDIINYGMRPNEVISELKERVFASRSKEMIRAVS